MLIRSRFCPFPSRRWFLRKPLLCCSRAGFFLFVSVTISLTVVLGFQKLPVSTTLGSGYSGWNSVPHLPISDLENSQKFWNISQRQDQYAITAILPVTTQSLGNIHANLESLFSARSSAFREVIILCPSHLTWRTESAAKDALNSTNPRLALRVMPSNLSHPKHLGVLHALPNVATSHVLMLESTALGDVDHQSKMVLLQSLSSDIPVGFRGVIVSRTNVSCASSSQGMVSVAYLLPPFISPTSLLIEAENGMRLDSNIWAALGERIIRVEGSGFGGMVISTTANQWHICMDSLTDQPLKSWHLETFYALMERQAALERHVPLRICILLPSLENLENFGPTACAMALRGAVLHIILFSWSHSNLSTRFSFDVGCHLHFETISREDSTTNLISKLKRRFQDKGIINVLIYASRTSVQTHAIEASLEPLRLTGVTVVRLPLDDLPFCEWMSVLSFAEWRNWKTPRIDLSVITNNRPRSLARLLASLKNARYYGDSVQLKINLEQTADAETRQLVAYFDWDLAPPHVQHRVVAGGLLPAVMEAWYPHGNDSYGVLLEDDVELSPMFYAWAKMTILKYRYGASRTRASALFGVSFYQPKNLELRVEGRVPFEPRILFSKNGVSDVRTPYLSQVPCSWGAVYFPEHFVELHDYLGLRLSEVSHDISTVIIPDIRSNRWTRSWKKYMNELVFLRGYVMLYPNYDLSLATNHVEVGTHVKNRPGHFQDSIKRQFEVPLMPLPSTSGNSQSGGLLELPGGSLPSWDRLPVLDLLGIVTSHQEIINRGQQRHKLVSGCPSLVGSMEYRYDARELLCAQHPTP